MFVYVVSWSTPLIVGLLSTVSPANFFSSLIHSSAVTAQAQSRQEQTVQPAEPRPVVEINRFFPRPSPKPTPAPCCKK